MSTYWYLECLDHDPPLISEFEVEQHTSGLDSIRKLIARREQIVALPDFTSNGYFDLRAVRFIRQHPTCRLQFRNEYGDVEPVTFEEKEGTS